MAIMVSVNRERDGSVTTVGGRVKVAAEWDHPMGAHFTLTRKAYSESIKLTDQEADDLLDLLQARRSGVHAQARG